MSSKSSKKKPQRKVKPATIETQRATRHPALVSTSEKEIISAEQMEAMIDESLRERKRLQRANLPLLILATFLVWGAKLLWLMAYVLSIYQAYRANGFPKVLLIAIPVVGQLIWLGVMANSVGFFNLFSYVVIAAILSRQIGKVVGRAAGIDNDKR